MHRAGLADEARAEDLEHFVHGNQGAPEAAGIFLVILGMHAVLVEGDRVRHLDRHVPDLHVNLERSQR